MGKHKLQIGKQNISKGLYSSEEIQNISSLGDILRSVRARLIKDGVSLEKERKKLLKEKKLAIM